VARKSVQGIEPRHERKCEAKGWEECKCKRTYQANVWSKRDGKRIRRTFPTLKAATIWRSDAMKGLRDGKLRAPTPDTVRQAGDALIAGMLDGSVRDRSGKVYKPATRRSYEASLEKHVYPELGAHKLSAVTYPDLQDFVDRLAAQGLDGSTIRNTINPLRVMYRRARYSVPVNPTTGLEIVARGEKPKRVVTAEIAARMVESIGQEERALRATAFYAGLRSGELQALRIEDVQLFPAGRWGLLHVRQGWDKREGPQGPKSTAGARTLPVCEQLYDRLSEHLQGLGRTSGLIFGRTESQPFSYSGVRDRAMRAYEAAKLEPSDLQLHECRHSFKTFLEDADIRESRVDRYMGHADHSVQGRYSHQSDAKYLEDAQALTGFLRRADTPTRVDNLVHFPIVARSVAHG
jgi:integrase